MSVIYLHVGPHKTGTTYLQEIFTSQSGALQKQGILYPSIARGGLKAHHNIAWYFGERPLSNEKKMKTERDIARLAEIRMDMLLSSEEFSRLSDAQLIKLKQAFPGKAFHVLYFSRKGIALIVSLWQESIKNGFSMPLDQITHTSLIEQRKYDSFDHQGNIARYEHCLGGTVTTFDYNTLKKGKKDLTDLISEVLNVKIKKKKKNINASLDMEIIELYRAANLYSATLGKPRSGKARVTCERILKFPFLGAYLRYYVNKKFSQLHQTLSQVHFLEAKFQPPHFLDDDINLRYNYIPQDVFLNELNQHNILPWRIIKKMIREN